MHVKLCQTCMWSCVKHACEVMSNREIMVSVTYWSIKHKHARFSLQISLKLLVFLCSSQYFLDFFGGGSTPLRYFHILNLITGRKSKYCKNLPHYRIPERNWIKSDRYLFSVWTIIREIWRENRAWLQYDDKEGAMFCTSCKTTSKQNEFLKGCRSFRLKSAKIHENSEVHKHACEVSGHYNNYIRITERGKTISENRRENGQL
jgi:hypothetical protein